MSRPFFQTWSRRRVQRRVRSFEIALALGLLTLSLTLACGSPIGPFSGGRLSGQEGVWPTDWNQFMGLDTLQLETGGEDPYSVNLWFAVVGGSPYLATSLLAGTHDPADRRWVQNIANDERVRVRVKELVYPGRLEEITDPQQIDRAFEALFMKYPNLDESRRDSARYFRIVARSGAGAAAY